MDFVAIDFETANRAGTSACSVGLAIVRQGKIVDTYETLIRPEPFYFLPEFIDIHGIRPEQVEHEGDFSVVWPELYKRIAGQCLVAHNAPFDRGVLNACLAFYGIKFHAPQFACTVRLARHGLPQLPNHKLDTLCRHLNIELDHHKAGSDSVACAKIALHLCAVNKMSLSQGILAPST